LNQLSEEGNYSLSITNLKNTCKTYTNIVLKKDIEKPIAHAGLDKDILKCKENQINLDGNQSSKGNQYQYAWSTPDGTILSGENSLEPIISSKGTYTINVKNIQNYCQNTANVIIGEQDKLAAAFDNTIVDFSISLKDFTNGKILNRVWQFGDGTFSAEQNPTHTYNKSGAYQLCLIVENDCNSDTLCKTIIVKEILGLKENNESSSISIFPNPAKGKVNLKLDSNIKSFDLHLMNSLKENILIKKIKNPTENIEIDLTNFPSGIYYILCQTDKTNFIKKILIEN
jgi:PKD repeat protein